MQLKTIEVLRNKLLEILKRDFAVLFNTLKISYFTLKWDMNYLEIDYDKYRLR